MPKPRPKGQSNQSQFSHLLNAFSREGIYRDEEHASWRISQEPFWLSQEQASLLLELGDHLLAFYRAINLLYFESLKGRQPGWISRYLNMGKPETVLLYGQMKRFRSSLPLVIRPDMIPTDKGFTITELDSVPGGIGLTGCLSIHYEALGFQVLGGGHGMMEGFSKILNDSGRPPSPQIAAILVSEESKAYRPEMTWLAAQLSALGHSTTVVDPTDVVYSDEGLLIHRNGHQIPVHRIYRFFELFDLKNIPKMELILYSVKKGRTRMTPPLKAHLEEKMAFAFLHHPMLESFWKRELAPNCLSQLKNLIPPTWIMDPTPVPPHALIPQVQVSGQSINDWHYLSKTTQAQRRFVIKPSGFSDLAWGSRGVSVGHDLSQSEWEQVIETALSSFNTVPYIIQPFYNGKKYDIAYYDHPSGAIRPMQGRARISPYYFVHNDKASLGGVLATVCPLDKKLIHGMKDAVMAPCAVKKA